MPGKSNVNFSSEGSYDAFSGAITFGIARFESIGSYVGGLDSK
jgi:hypothetical protein